MASSNETPSFSWFIRFLLSFHSNFIWLSDVTELIQVSVTLEKEETYKRELRVFSEAKKELRGEVKAILISFDDSKTLNYADCDIEVINILEFLLSL